MSDSIKVISVCAIDWPNEESELPRAKIQCGTLSYIFYNARSTNSISMDYFSQFKKLDESHHSAGNGTGTGGGGGNADGTAGIGNVKDILPAKNSTSSSNSNGTAIDLKTLSPKQLDKLSYYQILGNIKMHSTPEQIKKAFHRACLKYHPDKEESSANNLKASSPSSTPTKVKGSNKEEEKETKEDDNDNNNTNTETDKPKKKGEDQSFSK
jgi:hypothetical protein